MISIHKSTRREIKLSFYDNYSSRTPIDLSIYIDFVCAVIENGRVLIEKRYSTNGITTIKADDFDFHNKLSIVINPEDTQYLGINPMDEERQRIFEVYGIDKNGKPVMIYRDMFYLEGSGYYVKSLF